MSLRTKLLLLSAIIAIIPVAVVLFILNESLAENQSSLEQDFMSTLQGKANGIQDRIDRCLFERFGDVQAFGYNTAAHVDLEQITAEQRELLTASINRYVTGYGCYVVSMVVSPTGKVAAINTVQASGKELPTAELIGQDMSAQPWFTRTKNGEYSTGKDLLTGTVMQPPEQHPLVAKIYGEEAPNWTMSFVAPINDAKGTLVGYWHNMFGSSMIEQIVVSEAKAMSDLGMKNNEITVLDANGIILIDCDLAGTGKDLNAEALFKLNLKEEGVELAVEALGVTPMGTAISMHARKKVEQFGGYSRSVPILSFIGSGFATLVRDDGKSLSQSSQVFYVALISAATIVFLALLISWWFANRISRPIIHVAGGLNEGAEQIKAAASEVSAGAQRIAQGASEQAASLEETTASLEELSATCSQNANNARQANALAGEAAAASEAGENAARRAATEVNNQLQELAKAIASIRASTEKTTQVVESIDDIAIQINLLALNAAVEAARAGEAGLGFAVVADEVRNLAARSTEEAKNTSALIRESRASTDRVHQVSQQVQEYLGRALDQDMVGNFQKLVTMVRKVAQLSAEVAAASDEQSKGVGQINSAVAQMDKVTQENAASAEQSAASSEEMQAQAVALSDGVGQLGQVVGIRASAGEVVPAAPVRSAAPKDKKTVAPSTNGKHSASTNGHRPTGKEQSPAQMLPLTDDEAVEHKGDFSRF